CRRAQKLALRHHQMERVVGVRTVLAARDRIDRPSDSGIDTGAADDDDSRNGAREAECGDPCDLSTLERENPVTGAGAVIAATRDSARCVERASVRTGLRHDFARECELIADQRRRAEALT